jgi:hypothetical protein
MVHFGLTEASISSRFELTTLEFKGEENGRILIFTPVGYSLRNFIYAFLDFMAMASTARSLSFP